MSDEIQPAPMTPEIREAILLRLSDLIGAVADETGCHVDVIADAMVKLLITHWRLEDGGAS